jgi:hypothetical protein
MQMQKLFNLLPRERQKKELKRMEALVETLKMKTPNSPSISIAAKA